MIVDISKIAELYGTSLEIQLAEEINGLEINGQIIEFVKPVSLTGKITNLEQIFMLDGIITSAIKINCDRCLDEFEYNFEAKVLEKFSKDLSNENDEIFQFQGDSINLDAAVRSNIILNLPMQNLCSDKCTGLCSKCGTNLNISQCNCGTTDVDPRLEKLKSLLKID